MFNGNPIPGAKEPLLVKFADGGNKKKALYNKQNDNNGRAWRDNNDSITQVVSWQLSIHSSLEALLLKTVSHTVTQYDQWFITDSSQYCDSLT